MFKFAFRIASKVCLIDSIIINPSFKLPDNILIEFSKDFLFCKTSLDYVKLFLGILYNWSINPLKLFIPNFQNICMNSLFTSSEYIAELLNL